jgi:hypothetical protein
VRFWSSTGQSLVTACAHRGRSPPSRYSSRLECEGFGTIGFNESAQTEYRPVGTSTSVGPATYRQVTVNGKRPGWGGAAFHAMESATSLLRPTPARSFTPVGKASEIGLHLLGPVLLGLAILSIRGD